MCGGRRVFVRVCKRACVCVAGGAGGAVLVGWRKGCVLMWSCECCWHARRHPPGLQRSARKTLTCYCCCCCCRSLPPCYQACLRRVCAGAVGVFVGGRGRGAIHRRTYGTSSNPHTHTHVMFSLCSLTHTHTHTIRHSGNWRLGDKECHTAAMTAAAAAAAAVALCSHPTAGAFFPPALTDSAPASTPNNSISPASAGADPPKWSKLFMLA